MKNLNKFISVIISITIMMLSLFILSVSALSTGNIGVNETNIIWSLDEKIGILTVSGSGEMKSLNISNGFSGKSELIKQVIITGDIENIGSYMFAACTSLVNVSIPESIKTIENNAFLYCEEIENVYYEGTKAQWEEINIATGGNSYLLNATINYKNEPHVCTFGEWRITKEPTCVGTGSKTRECSCGIKETKTMPATRIHNFEWQTSKQATCTENGVEKQHCSVCTAVGETRTINKFGHNIGEWQESDKPTCTNSGLKVKKCENCGEVLEQENIVPSGHDFGAWKTTIKGTEEQNGEESRTCKKCKYTETRVVDNIQSNDKVILGDANGDGKVMATDARLVLQVVAGIKETKDLNFVNADANKDNQISAIDARFILQIVAGIK